MFHDHADRVYEPLLRRLEEAELLPVALHLLWQVATLDPEDPANPLDRFRSNRWAGALMAAACFIVGNAYAGASL